MSYDEKQAAVERYAQAGLRADYFWAPTERNEDFGRLSKLVKKEEANGAHYRFYPAMTEEGQVTLWVCVYDAEGNYLDGFDDIFPCPPRC